LYDIVEDVESWRGPTRRDFLGVGDAIAWKVPNPRALLVQACDDASVKAHWEKMIHAPKLWNWFQCGHALELWVWKNLRSGPILSGVYPVRLFDLRRGPEKGPKKAAGRVSGAYPVPVREGNTRTV